MEHRGTDDERHGDGQDQLGIRRGVRPGTAMPPTVLLTELDNGTLVLQGRPDGPRGYLTPGDALPLMRALTVALQRMELTATADDQGEAP